MRKIKLLILSLLVGVLYGPQLHAQDGYDSWAGVKVKFLNSYDEALKEAAATNKPIFFDCFANWAVPCHSMNRVVFSDEKFAQWLNEHFVCLCLEMTAPENQYLVQKYNVRFYAHFLILDPQGNLIHRIVGGSKLPEFQEQVARGLDPQRTLTGMNKRFEDGERDVEFLRDYVDVLAHGDGGDKLPEVIKLFVSSIDTSELDQKQNWFIFTQVATDIHSPYYHYLLSHYDDFVNENGKEQISQYISLMNIRALYPVMFDAAEYKADEVAGIKEVMDKYLSSDDVAYVYYDAAKARGEGRILDFIAILRQSGDRVQPEIVKIADVNLVLLIPDHPEWKEDIETYLRERLAQAPVPSVAQAYKDALFSVENDGKGVKFEEGTFAEALALAKKENKLVFMDCYTAWCGPCKILAKKIFPIKEIGDFFNAHFVNIQMDMEKGEGKELAKRYDVKAYPTLLIVDADGNLVHRVTGVRPPQQLLEQMERGLSEETAYAPVKAKYDAGDRSPRVVTEYLLNMFAAGDMSEAQMNQAAKDYFASLSDEEKLSGEMIVFFENFATEPTHEAARYFLLHWKEYEALAADRDAAEKALLRIYFPALMNVLPEPDLNDANLSAVLADIKEAGILKEKTTLAYLVKVVELAADKDWEGMFKFYQKKVSKLTYKFGQMNLDMLWKRFWQFIPQEMKVEVKAYLEAEQRAAVKTSVNNYKNLLEALQ